MSIKDERHTGFPFSLNKAALLVIDMQKYFTCKDSHAYMPASQDIIPRINSLIDLFKKAQRPVVFTRHIDIDPDNLMNRWWQGSIKKDDPLSVLNPNINTDYGKIIIKHQYDAFMGTRLEELLKKEKTEQVVITGVVTHLCCETTARAAFMRNFETFFVIDATAAFDEEHHKAAIFNLAHGFAVPVKTEELVGVTTKLPLRGEGRGGGDLFILRQAEDERAGPLSPLQRKKVSTIIIGAGPAGIAAAIQLRRAKHDFIIIEKGEIGGLLLNANLVENYPGFPDGVSGPGLVEKFKKHLDSLKIESLAEEVIDVEVSPSHQPPPLKRLCHNVVAGLCPGHTVDFKGGHREPPLHKTYCDTACKGGGEPKFPSHLRGVGNFLVKTTASVYICRNLIIATGTRPKELNIDTSLPLYYDVYPLRNTQGKRVAIIGGGDSAFDYALNLAKSNNVSIFVRGKEAKCLPLLHERAKLNENIRIYLGTDSPPPQPSSLKGEGEFDIILAAIGRVPNLDFFSSSIDLLEKKNIPGLYCAGDAARGNMRQTIIAMGDGLRAAMGVLQNENN